MATDDAGTRAGIAIDPVVRPRAAVRIWALRLTAAAILGYAAVILWLMASETRLIFRPGGGLGTARPSAAYDQVDLPRPDGVRQFAWRMPAHAGTETAPWVLFLHGQTATIGSRINIFHYERLRDLGLNVFAPEYRGYAGLDGTPTEATVADDARAAWDYLVTTARIPPSRIVIYGWSLGSAVGVTLAAGVDEGAVILEGAPSSIAGLGQQRYPLIPVRLIIRNPFESIARIDRIGSPVLFLHSTEDVVVPIAEGRRLYEAARAPKTFVEVRGGHVEAAERDTHAFFGAIRRFLVTAHLLPPDAE